MSTHIATEMDIKTESSDSDAEFDPMQFESTKMVRLIDTSALDHETETVTIKREYDVKIENPFRQEMLDNSNEVAYVAAPNFFKAVKKEPAEEQQPIIVYVFKSNPLTSPSQIYKIFNINIYFSQNQNQSHCMPSNIDTTTKPNMMTDAGPLEVSQPPVSTI